MLGVRHHGIICFRKTAEMKEIGANDPAFVFEHEGKPSETLPTRANAVKHHQGPFIGIGCGVVTMHESEASGQTVRAQTRTFQKDPEGP
jgi:hypothetical protein